MIDDKIVRKVAKAYLRYCDELGALGIVISRFSGPLRASVPIVAGIAEMPWLRFQLANWSSALLWALVLLSPGTWGSKWLTQHMG